MDRNREIITKGMRWALGGLVVLFIGGSIISFYIFRDRAKTEMAAHAGDIQAGITALTNFDFSAAAQQFKLAGVTSSQMTAMGNIAALFTSGHNPVSAF